MKRKYRLSAILLIIVLLGWVTGCQTGDVQLRGAYPQLLAETAAWSAQVAAQSQAGKLTQAEQNAILGVQADLWARFLAASRGVSMPDGANHDQ